MVQPITLTQSLKTTTELEALYGESSEKSPRRDGCWFI